MCVVAELVTHLLTQLQLDSGWRMNLNSWAQLRLSICCRGSICGNKGKQGLCSPWSIHAAPAETAETLLSTWPDSRVELGLRLCASRRDVATCLNLLHSFMPASCMCP